MIKINYSELNKNHHEIEKSCVFPNDTNNN